MRLTHPSTLPGLPARLRAPVAAGAVAALALSALATVPARADDPPLPQPTECPTALPTVDAVDGLQGTGWTVERGTQPDPFTAKVLGRIDDGIAPGIDMIMAEVSSAALTRAGGVWAGMSGSPVYTADGRLIGSVSWGLTSTASNIAGITPAASLAGLLDNDPDGTGLKARSRVAVPRSAAKRLAATGEVSAAEAAQGFHALPMPLNVSGVSGGGAAKLTKRLSDRVGVRVTTGGAGAPNAAGNPDSIFGGSNIVAAVSYGYVTLSGTGTTTYTCDGQAVAFGHPWFSTGVSSYSAHPATSVYIQKDDVWGPFKMANPGGVVGTVDRDRTVGIRTELGQTPAATTITSSVGRSGSTTRAGGTTHAVYDEFTPDSAAYHALYTVDQAMGSSSAKGSFRGTLKVQGTRAGGRAFTLTLGNAFAAPTSTTSYPLDFQVADWVYSTLSDLLGQEFEQVRLTKVDLTGTASPDGAYWRLPSLRVMQSGTYVNPANRTVRATAGHRLWWKATAPLYQKAATTQVRTASVLPPASSSGRSAYVVVESGQAFEAAQPQSLSALLAQKAAAPRNDDVRVELRRADNDRLLASGTMHFTRVVAGFANYYDAEIR